ncbi:MAG TPA: alpha/beta hydrolase [Solirubrobacteraceae bacterium]|jgi:pimeloyl-ACP methyl ester carboxylesterase|nr:alpha/beta hydrolase [Solirubrobacteraceae bacterium]
MSELPNVVLVHGAWADGSSWSAVIRALQAKGYNVTAPQLPETSLADDVARVRHVLRRQSGPTIVAGHSWGGQVMTALGTDAPNVTGLVYVAAFGLEEGESLGALLGGGPPTPSLAHLIVDEQSFGWLPEEDFVNHFASGLDPADAKVLYAVQQGLSMSAFEDVMGTPAWKSRPSWYLVATNDEAIPPDAERMFAQRMGAHTIEVASRPPGDGLSPRGGRRADRAGLESGFLAMPMIDVYAAAWMFEDKHSLAQNLASAVMRWERVPDLPLSGTTRRRPYMSSPRARSRT